MRHLSYKDREGLLKAAGDAAAGLGAMAFFIAFGLVFVLLFRPFYLFELDHLNIVEMSGFSREEILVNYDALIRWCMPWIRSEFSLPTFSFSPGAAYHFEQVKSVFRIVWILGTAGGLVFILLLRSGLKDGRRKGLRTAGLTVLAVPFLLGLFAAVDFNRAFILFHEVVFRNDYWIFDQTTDPVILILPEAYFMHCFALILAIVGAGAFLLLWLGRRKDL